MVSNGYHEELWKAMPEGLEPPELRLRREFTLRRADRMRTSSGPATRVLDVGCGEAQLTLELDRAGFAAVGVDVAEEPLRRARVNHPELDLRVVPIEGEWPFSDASFDVVWAGETIEHVADTAGWLSELRRVLRSGGNLLLSTPAHGRIEMLSLALSARRLDSHFDPRSDHLRFYTRRTLLRLLEDFGFQEIEIETAGGIPGARTVLLASAVRSRF